MPRVVLRSSDSVAKHQAQLVLLPVENTVSTMWSECEPLPFSLLVTSLEEEAGTTTCSPFVKLLSRCRCRLWLWLLLLGQPVWSMVFLWSLPHFQHLDCRKLRDRLQYIQGLRHSGVWFLVGSRIEATRKSSSWSKSLLFWLVHLKLENCEKPQPTNCEAHWFFALGFDVLPDINNNYVILTWLPSVHASRSTCAYKRCCSANALSLIKCFPTFERFVICADVSFSSLAFQNGLLNYEVFQTQEESVTLPLTPFSSTSYLNWTFNILPAALQPHMVHCCHSPDCIFDTQALSNLQQTKRPPPGATHGEGVTPTAL